jgi:hypothetical protein
MTGTSITMRIFKAFNDLPLPIARYASASGADETLNNCSLDHDR